MIHPSTIKTVRKHFGSTIESTAHSLNLSPRTFARYESGDSDMPYPTFIVWLAINNVKAVDLINKTIGGNEND